MSRCYKSQFVCRTSAVERKDSLPVGPLLTMAMGTGVCGSCNMCGKKSAKKLSSLLESTSPASRTSAVSDELTRPLFTPWELLSGAGEDHVLVLIKSVGAILSVVSIKVRTSASPLVLVFELSSLASVVSGGEGTRASSCMGMASPCLRSAMLPVCCGWGGLSNRIPCALLTVRHSWK
jgi:hypothetical protein